MATATKENVVMYMPMKKKATRETKEIIVHKIFSPQESSVPLRTGKIRYKQ